MTIVLMILCVGFSIFVLGMLGLHTYISLLNITTYEFLKDQWDNVTGNPFMKYFYKNTENLYSKI